LRFHQLKEKKEKQYERLIRKSLEDQEDDGLDENNKELMSQRV